MEACVFSVCACSLSRKQSVVTLPTASDKVGYQAQWASRLVWKYLSLCAFPFLGEEADAWTHNGHATTSMSL